MPYFQSPLFSTCLLQVILDRHLLRSIWYTTLRENYLKGWNLHFFWKNFFTPLFPIWKKNWRSKSSKTIIIALFFQLLAQLGIKILHILHVYLHIKCNGTQTIKYLYVVQYTNQAWKWGSSLKKTTEKLYPLKETRGGTNRDKILGSKNRYF